jgi:DNA polymerase-4
MLSKWRYALSASKVMKGDMELYSKLSHDTQVIEESTHCSEKASIDEFI